MRTFLSQSPRLRLVSWKHLAGTACASACLFAAWFASGSLAREPDPPRDVCQRPEIGSAVLQPQDLLSQNGVLQVDLTIRNQKEPDGPTRYCYTTADGAVSPTLRLKPGDLLILRFKNDLIDFSAVAPSVDIAQQQTLPFPAPICTSKKTKADPCTSGAMTATSSNLHFHGLTVPPVCHEDDVLKTSIQPDDAP